MTFFEPPPPVEQPEHRQPEWLGPPENVLGAAVPLQLLLARTEEVALAIGDAAAYPNGFSFSFALRRRRADPEHFDPFERARFHMRGGEVTDDVLRLGIQFADGRKATTLDAFPPWDPSEAPPRNPVLIPHGGGGGGRSWDMRFWVWPLPPSGPLAFVCEWPAEGIALTRHEVEARAIVEAAAQAEELWPDGGAQAGGGCVGSTRIG